MFNKLPIAWLQLSREKMRLLVAMAGIAFADILIFMQLGFQDALYDSNTKIHDSLQGNLFLISTQSETLTYMESFSQRRLYQALAAPGVKSVNPLYIDVIRWKNPQTLRRSTILALGIKPSGETFNLPDIQENLHKIKYPDVVLLDRASSPKYGTVKIVETFEKGKKVITEVGGKRVEIGGLFTLGTSFAADGNFITSDLNFLRLFKHRDSGHIEIGIIVLDNKNDIQEVLEYLKVNLPNDVRVLTKQDFINFEKEYWSSSTPIGYLFGLGAIMGFIVGSVIVYQILYTDVSNHLPEYATLKAIGYTDFYLLKVVFQEALILAILGYLPGFVISVGLYTLAQNATLLPIGMKISRTFIVLISTIIMCFIAGSLAVFKLKKADPADVF